MYRQVMTSAIAERMRWKAEYEAAKTLAGRDVDGSQPPARPP
jgi:hypothetical protein